MSNSNKMAMEDIVISKSNRLAMEDIVISSRNRINKFKRNLAIMIHNNSRKETTPKRAIRVERNSIHIRGWIPWTQIL